MRYQEIIVERTGNDVDNQRLASKAYRMLADYLNAGGKSQYDITIGDTNYYGISPYTLKFDKEFGITDTLVMIGLRKPRSVVMAGNVSRFTDPVDGKYPQAIVVHSMREFNEDAMVRSVNTTDFMSTFKHEFVHVLDFIRTNNKIIRDEPLNSKDEKSYYNDPAEFNAYFHTFADNWLDILGLIQREPHNAKDYADLYGITDNFKDDLDHLINQSSQSRAFFKNLSDDRKKSILRRLYRLHDELMKAIHSPSLHPAE